MSVPFGVRYSRGIRRSGPATVNPLHRKPSSARWTGVIPIRRRYDTGHGSASQIPAAYSAMVRSLENLPEPATFRIALQAQPCGSAYSSSSRRSASRHIPLDRNYWPGRAKACSALDPRPGPGPSRAGPAEPRWARPPARSGGEVFASYQPASARRHRRARQPRPQGTDRGARPSLAM